MRILSSPRINNEASDQNQQSGDVKQSAAVSNKQPSDRDKMIYNFKAKQKSKKRHYAPTLSERLQVVPEYCRIHTKN